MWKCDKCKREFQKTNQSHSCVSFALEKHFESKDKAKELFDYLKSQIIKHIGPVKIESLLCCIHFVSSYTFGACWALKDGIRIDFRVDYPIVTKRVHKLNQISTNRYLYYFDIKSKSEINDELLGWIKKSYNLNK
jgi:hypothetical protein